MAACSVSERLFCTTHNDCTNKAGDFFAIINSYQKQRRTSSSRGSDAVLLSGLLLSACMLEAQATWPLTFLCRTAILCNAMLRFALPHRPADSAVHGALP